MKLAETHLAEPIALPADSAFPPEFITALDAFEFNHALDQIWERIQTLDERITREEPFKLVKSDLEKGKAMIAELAAELYQIGRLLYPFMPEANEKIKEAVTTNTKPESLFPRL
jgi:methionyl-tRNA synthetase